MASVNDLLILSPFLLRAALKTSSHISSQYEILVGIPVPQSASLEDRMGQMIDNTLLWTRSSEQILGHSLEYRQCIN